VESARSDVPDKSPRRCGEGGRGENSRRLICLFLRGRSISPEDGAKKAGKLLQRLLVRGKIKNRANLRKAFFLREGSYSEEFGNKLLSIKKQKG